VQLVAGIEGCWQDVTVGEGDPSASGRARWRACRVCVRCRTLGSRFSVRQRTRGRRSTVAGVSSSSPTPCPS